MKDILIGNKKVKSTSIYIWYYLIYRKPKEFPQKLLELINELRNYASTRLIYKNCISVHIKWIIRKLYKENNLIYNIKKNKILGIYLTEKYKIYIED